MALHPSSDLAPQLLRHGYRAIPRVRAEQGEGTDRMPTLPREGLLMSHVVPGADGTGPFVPVR